MACPGVCCGMSPAPLSPQTVELVRRLFAPADRGVAEQWLVEQCGTNLPDLEQLDAVALERYRFAALRFAGGRIEQLVRAVELAKTDWRDLLMAADFGHDVKAHSRWAAAVLAK